MRSLMELGARRVLEYELPAFAGAFAIAEVFYKFHSFTLECLAFLATWFVFGSASRRIQDLRRWGSGQRRQGGAARGD